MKVLCHLNKKDCLRLEWQPPDRVLQRLEFYRTSIKVFWSFNAAKQLLNLCSEKGTSLSLLNWNIQMYWLLLSVLVNPAFIKTQFYIKWWYKRIQNICTQNKSDNLQAESCKDWNFTEQAVKFFGHLLLLNSYLISVLKKELVYRF